MSHSTRVRGLKLSVGLLTVTLISSHSTRVRGLKYVLSSFVIDPISRTLHECVDWNWSCWNGCCWKACRTLHECVDWNLLMLRYKISVPSRTLHECVDWNIHIYVVVVFFLVALYTSAWIEINGAAWTARTICRRTLHECVDWNRTDRVPHPILF